MPHSLQTTATSVGGGFFFGGGGGNKFGSTVSVGDLGPGGGGTAGGAGTRGLAAGPAPEERAVGDGTPCALAEVAELAGKAPRGAMDGWVREIGGAGGGGGVGAGAAGAGLAFAAPIGPASGCERAGVAGLFGAWAEGDVGD